MNAEKMAAAAEKILRGGAVLVSAADYRDGRLSQVQLYFWSEHQSVMDIVSKEDLVENWPDEGVYVMNFKAENEAEALTKLHIVDGEEDFYIRAAATNDPEDDLGELPCVDFMSAMEQISTLKDKIKL